MGKKGFTLVELIMIIVIIGILAVVAIPRYFDLRTNALDAAEIAVVGAVRSGIHIYYAKEQMPGGSGDYAPNLDSGANDGISFDIVIVNGIDAGGTGEWSDGDGSAQTYTAPDGTTVYTYDPTNGSFTITTP